MPDVKLGPKAVLRTQVAPGADFNVPLAAFLSSLKGTPDEIWTRLLKLDHGREIHTLSGWADTLKNLRNRRI